MDIALANAARCSGSELNYIRNSFADFQKRPAARDTFLHVALLGNRRCINRPGNRATFLAGTAPMDAAHVANFYSSDPVTRCLGRDHGWFALATAAVLSRTCVGFAQFD
jgi:hypothetical protein